MALRKIGEIEEGAVTVKVHKESETGEYRVRTYINGKANEAADYFTDDLDDAWGTAQCILTPIPQAQLEAGAIFSDKEVQATGLGFQYKSRNQREGRYFGRVYSETAKAVGESRHARTHQPEYSLRGRSENNDRC